MVETASICDAELAVLRGSANRRHDLLSPVRSPIAWRSANVSPIGMADHGVLVAAAAERA
jgi:hypothetical protein